MIVGADVIDRVVLESAPVLGAEIAAEIILGHRPLSDYDGLVQTWRSSAGDQIRKEYLDSIAAGG